MFFSPKVYQPLPYKYWHELVDHYIRPGDVARTVQVSRVRMFTTEEDVRQLFVESGLQPELILMSYDAEIGLSHTNRELIVLLKNPEQVWQAIKDLDGAIIFDSRLCVVPHHKTPNPGYVEYYWGWFAVSDPSLFKQRAPMLEMPTDVSGTPTRMEAN
jgi:hypothetical protein